MAYVFAMRPAEDRQGHSARPRLAFTYFRRVREPGSARGYRQTSVVLLATLPFHSLFLKVARRLGRLYFAFGLPILEVAMATLNAWCAAPPRHLIRSVTRFPAAAGGEGKWARLRARTDPPMPARPAPVPGAEMHLPFMGLHLHFHCPAAEPASAFLSLPGAQPAFHRLYQDIPLYSAFAALPQCLWHMWQRVLCGESVAVYSESPQQCSAAVLGLASLIAPVEYRGEIHPYLTIYDSSYSSVRPPVPHPYHCADSAHRSLPLCTRWCTRSPKSGDGTPPTAPRPSAPPCAHCAPRWRRRASPPARRRVRRRRRAARPMRRHRRPGPSWWG